MRSGLFCVAAIVVLLGSCICQSRADEISASVSFSQSELSFQKIDNYDVVYMKDCDITRAVGEPLLPVRLVHVSLPPGAVVEDVEVVAEEVEELEGRYNIYPVQPPQILGKPDEQAVELEFVEPKASVYRSWEAYPSDRVVSSQAGSMGGYHIAGFLVYPLQYIPAEGKLLFSAHMTFRIQYSARSTETRLFKGRQRKVNEVQRRSVEKVVLNPEGIGVRSGLRGDIISMVPPGEYEYVIITGEQFVSAFQPLADWKTKKGVPANIVNTDWIYENYPGVDRQEQIRNCIRDAYENWGTLWVLLGGDTNILPCRLTWAMDCEYGGEPDENDIPADLYYADLDGTWDENENGTFGEVDDNVDLYPDVFVGRATVNTLSDVNTFVHKIMTYEKPVETDQFMKYLFLGEIMWQDPYTCGGEGKDMIDDECVPPRFDPITKLYQSKGNENHETVMEALNDGYHIINHDGHCWWTVMGVGGGSLVREDMDALRNDPAYGIIYSIGCWPAAIDYNCIAEHFVNNPDGGGVAYIGNSRYGWGSPGNPGYGYSDRFDHRFYIELFENGISNIGATLGATKAYYVNRSQQENVYRIHQYEVNLLGDPEMDIWTNTPMALTVEHPCEMPAGWSIFTVTVSSENEPVKDALVCVMNGADVYHRGFTDATGQAEFQINPNSADTIWVTVTAHDYLPYEGYASILTQGPYVEKMGHYYMSTPNGDEFVNPGEQIELTVSLANKGNEDAINVIILFRTDDPYASVLDSIYGPVDLSPPTEKVQPIALSSYTFEVSPQAQNGHTIQFTLEMTDSVGHVWRDIIPITVAAPALVLDEYRVDGSAGDNGLIEPDDTTASFEVDIRNTGLGVAYTVSLRPQVGTCDIAILDTLLDLGDIRPGSTATVSYAIEFLPLLCPVPEFDTYTLMMNTGDGFSFTDGFAMTRHQGYLGFTDDVEEGEGGWTHEDDGDLWHLTRHRSHSGNFSWYCGHEDRWKYDKDMDCSLISDQITLGPRACLSFWHWYEVAVYGVNGVLVEIDDGSGWTKLDFIGSGGALLPIGNDWIEDTYDLSAYPSGTQIQVRFRFVSDGERTFEGMYIDDVQVSSDYSAPVPLLDMIGYSIDDDTIDSSYGNGNGYIDCGETIELAIDVINHGDALAPAVTIDLNTRDPYVSILSEFFDLGDIGPGRESSDGDPFLLRISEKAPNRQDIYLTLEMEDGKGYSWEESIVLTVSQPEFVIDAFAAPDVVGNGDGEPDRGEACTLILSLKNTGLRPAEGIAATITTPCADVVIIDGTSSFSNISVDSIGDNAESPFLFYIESNTTNHVIPFQIRLKEGGGFCKTEISFSVLMNQEQVFLVADDGLYGNADYYTEILSTLGVPYRLWSVIDEGEVPEETILSYGQAIWFTGAEASNTLTAHDRDILSHFLDAGGHLILSGQMIGVYNSTTEFFSEYLHAGYISFMTQLHHLTGVEGNPITDDMYIHLADGGPNNQGFSGEIDPIAPAFGIFEYDRETDEGPGMIRSSGIGAIAVETDGYKVAYFSFGLEGIEPFESRYDVFEALFSWFHGQPVDVRAKPGMAGGSVDDDDEGESNGDGDGFPNPGENIELVVSIVNTGLLAGENINGTLSASDDYITVIDSAASFGNIDPGSTIEASDAFSFFIAPETPQGHTVEFDLSLVDAKGNCWSEVFTFTIYMSSTCTGCITDEGTGLGISWSTLYWNGPWDHPDIEQDVGYVTSDENGDYEISLIDGLYYIQAAATGFLPSDWIEIEFPPDSAGVDFTLTSPQMECEPAFFAVSLNPGETQTALLEIGNTNTGVLHYACLEMAPFGYKQSPGGSIHHPRPFQIDLSIFPESRQSVAAEHTVAPDPEGWKLIYVDEDEEGIMYDFDRLYAQHDEQDLYIKIKAQEPWSNPRFDFYVYIFIDADRNPDTGMGMWYMGADYVIVAGAEPLLVRWDERSQVFDYQANLSYSRQLSDTDTLEVGIQLADIGSPQQIELYFHFYNIWMEQTDDQAPDGGLFNIPYSLYDAEWLSVDPLFGSVHEGESEEIALHFDAVDLLPGEYMVNLVIENNQPERDPVFIPVDLTVAETGIGDDRMTMLPAEYALAQNYPNPFNPKTDIRYQIPDGRFPVHATLRIYNILGQEIRALVEEVQRPGYYSVTWDGKNGTGNDVPTGIYFYKLTAGSFSQTRRMLLIK